MKNKKQIEFLDRVDACSEALEWLETQEDLQTAWANCLRSDWMLWLAQELEVELKPLTKAKILCALTVKHLMEYEISVKDCEVALMFSEGEALREELANAAAAAAAAAYSDYAAYSYAAYADPAYILLFIPTKNKPQTFAEMY